MTDQRVSSNEQTGSAQDATPAADAALNAWVGRERLLADGMDPGPATRLQRLFDDTSAARAGEPLPNGWQWLYFLPDAEQSAIGPDGHEKRGRFLPPVELPRRMFAAGSATYHRPLVLGQPAELTERIASITPKQGRAGPLVFVRVVRSFQQASQLVLEEEQTIVYRAPPQADAPAVAGERAAAEPQWRRQLQADATLLFRFSALTFNAHRIHYDRDYSRQEEGYPGLVVHGPLIAMLLLEEARRRSVGRALRQFRFRAIQPLFDTESCFLCGRFDGASATLWAETVDGSVAMQASAEFDPAG